MLFAQLLPVIPEDPLHLRDWAILVAAAGAFVVGILGSSVPIILAIGKLRSDHAIALASLNRDLQVVKVQTDGMSKEMTNMAKKIGVEEGKALGAASEIETGKEAFAAGKIQGILIEKAKNGV